MTQEKPTPQGEATPNNAESQSAPETGGVLGSGEQQAKPWAEQFPNDQDGSQVWQAYTELRKKLSAGEHKAPQQAESKPQPKTESNWSDEKEQKLQKYEVEARRQSINKELGLDFDTDQWRAVADFAHNNRTPEQLQAIEGAIEAGLYSVVRDLVNDYQNADKEQGEVMPTGESPRSSGVPGDVSNTPFRSADEVVEGLKVARKTNAWSVYEQRLALTDARIKNSITGETNRNNKYA